MTEQAKPGAAGEEPAQAPVVSPEDAAAAAEAAALAKIADVVNKAAKAKSKADYDARKEKARQRAADAATWEINLTYGRDGLHARTSNAVTILRNHEDWAGVLAFDEFRQTVMFLKPPPLAAEERLPDDTVYPHPLDDLDYTRINGWFERSRWTVSLSASHLHDAVDIASRHNRVHPVRDYLGDVLWDGEPRLDQWLVTYLGVRVIDCAAESEACRPLPESADCRARYGDDDPLAHARCPAHLYAEYVRLVGRYWMISAVARILNPPCKADGMLIIEGKQGLRKSSALRVLASPAWFQDSEVKIDGDRESIMQLHGRWIIEFSELTALHSADTKRLKQFLVLDADQYTPKWGKRQISVPRECVFAGTSNDSRYLRDETGGRRFWGIPATFIDLAALAQDRDQLWAEAVAIYRGADTCLKDAERRWANHPDRDKLLATFDICRGEHRCRHHRWWPTAHEDATIFAPQQDARFVTDPFEPIVESWLAANDSQTYVERNPDGTREWRIPGETLRRTILQMDAAQLTPAIYGRIRAVLARLGFKEAKRGPHRDARTRYWVRPIPDAAEQEAPGGDQRQFPGV